MSSLRSPRSGRSVVGLVALLALVLAATGCNPGQPPAATVEGADISAQHVDAIAEAFLAADPEVFANFEGAGTDTLAMDPYTQVLSIMIQLTLQSQLAAERDAVPTDEERTAAEDEARSTFLPEEEQTDPTAEPSQADTLNNDIYEALPTETQEWLVDLQADALALQRVVGEESGSQEEAARQFYDENPEQFATLCLRIMVVPESGVPDVESRLAGGEDFGEVSAEVSVDPAIQEAAGGEPQCVPLAQIQQQVDAETYPQFAAAQQGDIVGPLEGQPATETEEAIVVLYEVVEVQVPEFEEVRDQLLEGLPAAGEQALQDLVQEELVEAEVSVDPKFGTWVVDRGVNPQTGQPLPPAVEPPAPPTAPTAESPVHGGATGDVPG